MVAEAEKTMVAPEVAGPSAPPIPEGEPEAQAAPQLDFTPVLEDMKKLDSKGLKEKHPDIWEALRPHVDREVQVNRKNLEKQYADNAARSRAAQQVVSWYNSLNPVQRLTVMEDPRQAAQIHEARGVANTAMSQSDERVAERMLTNAIAQLKEEYPDIELDTEQANLAGVIKKGLQKERDAMNKETKEMVKELVQTNLKELLSTLNITAEQPPRVPHDTGSGGGAYKNANDVHMAWIEGHLGAHDNPSARKQYRELLQQFGETL
jgi:hypothetical protein